MWKKRSDMEILNGISVVRTGMIRHVDCEILADVSKDNGAFIVLKTRRAPGGRAGRL
jgi:hypothetical protein